LITTTVGVDTYTLPSYLLKIVQIRNSKGNAVVEKDIEDIWYSGDVFRTGNPTVYTTDYLTSTIKLFPVPAVSDKLSILMYRLPLSKLDIYSDKDVELRDEFLLPMLHYAASLCYMKDEANTLDPSRAKFFMELFDREFPFTSSYSTIRKSRTSNREVKYGGL
jgi:hypothetical protein